MKVYYTAGLRELAKLSGYRGQTLNSLCCKNFKRTIVFFCKHGRLLHDYSVHSNHRGLIESVKCILISGILEKCSPEQVMAQIEALVQDGKMYPNFQTFIHQMSQIDDAWKFWAHFVFSDCYCYVGLYLTIRGSSWKLHISSLKQMAPPLQLLIGTHTETSC